MLHAASDVGIHVRCDRRAPHPRSLAHLCLLLRSLMTAPQRRKQRPEHHFPLCSAAPRRRHVPCRTNSLPLSRMGQHPPLSRSLGPPPPCDSLVRVQWIPSTSGQARRWRVGPHAGTTLGGDKSSGDRRRGAAPAPQLGTLMSAGSRGLPARGERLRAAYWIRPRPTYRHAPGPVTSLRQGNRRRSPRVSQPRSHRRR